MLNKLDINPKKQILIVYIVLTIATLAAFWQVYQFDFINLDDPVYVTDNKNVQSGITMDGLRWAFSTTYAEFWHPLTWISLMVDYQLYGLNAGGYHLTNLILHIMSTLLLFWLFNRMTGAIWRSAFVAALFALHPLHVESVAWIAERKDVLSAFFWMLTLCLYVYYTEKPVAKRFLLVLLCFTCGLMSKSMIVTMPLVMILLDYWPIGRLQFNEHKLSEAKIAGIIPLWQLKEKIPFFLLSAVFSILTLYAQANPSKGFSFSSRIANAPVSFVTYLEKTFWPHDLAVFYPFSDQLHAWQVLGATLLIIAVSIAIILTVKRLPHLFVGWLWYAITVLPVIGIVQVGNHAMADRYTYLPTIGIGIMLAWGIPLLVKRKEMRNFILFPVGVFLIAILSFLTWQQCAYWENSIILYNHVLEVTKNNALAHYNLANALVKQKNIGEAIPHYLAAIKINPYSDRPYSNLGVALVAQGKNAEAIAHYLTAIKFNPNNSEAHSNLGIVLAIQGRNEEAIAHYFAAIKINPNYDDAYYNLANLYIRQQKIEEAIDNYRKAISINPDHFDAHNNLADVLVKQNKFEQAIEHFREAVRITPSSFAVLNNLGVNLERQLKHDEAIYYYSKAKLIEPQNPGIHFNLGVALGNKGDLKEAIEHFRQAVNLNPDFEEARRALKLAQELEKRR